MFLPFYFQKLAEKSALLFNRSYSRPPATKNSQLPAHSHEIFSVPSELRVPRKGYSSIKRAKEQSTKVVDAWRRSSPSAIPKASPKKVLQTSYTTKHSAGQKEVFSSQPVSSTHIHTFPAKPDSSTRTTTEPWHFHLKSFKGLNVKPINTTPAHSLSSPSPSSYSRLLQSFSTRNYRIQSDDPEQTSYDFKTVIPLLKGIGLSVAVLNNNIEKQRNGEQDGIIEEKTVSNGEEKSEEEDDGHKDGEISDEQIEREDELEKLRSAKLQTMMTFGIEEIQKADEEIHNLHVQKLLLLGQLQGLQERHKELKKKRDELKRQLAEMQDYLKEVNERDNVSFFPFTFYYTFFSNHSNILRHNHSKSLRYSCSSNRSSIRVFLHQTLFLF